MANKEAKEIVSETSVETKQTDRTFSVSALRGNCVKLFGCTSSTFDGAFFGQDTSKKYTIADAKQIINKWLGKEIS